MFVTILTSRFKMDDHTLEEILSRSTPEYLESCKVLSKDLPRVVISLTTVPGRYGILYDTLKTLANQDYPVAAIYLTIPKIAKRFGTPYPELPQHILDLVTVVNIDEDYGPICKIMGGLIMEPDPNTLVVTCDDDIWYSPNLVSSLVAQYLKQDRPKTAVSGSGLFISSGVSFTAGQTQSVFFHSWFVDLNIPKHGREVEILCGFSGVLYPRAAFPANKELEDLVQHTRGSKAIFHNDDILLSAYISSQGYKRVVVPDVPWVDELRLTASGRGSENQDEFALSHDFGVCLSRMQVAYKDCLKLGLFKDHPHYNYSETVAGKAIAVIAIIVILLLLICVLCYMFGDSWNTNPYHEVSYSSSIPLAMSALL